MKRQSLHLTTYRGQCTGVDRAQTLEQTDRRVDRVGTRSLEPFEGTGIAAPPDDVEHCAGQIDSMDIGFTMRPQPIASFPQSPDDARAGSSGTSGPLVSSILRDALGDQAVDRARGVIPSHFLKARIHDTGHTRNSYGRFGNIGGDDHSPNAETRRGQSPILLSGAERAMERYRLDTRGHPSTNLRNGLLNLVRPWKKTQDVTIRIAEHFADGVNHRNGRRVANLNRICAAGHANNRAAVEERGHAIGVEGGRHHNQSQIIARAPGLPA